MRALMLLLVLGHCASAARAADYLLPPAAKVAGKSQEAWSKAWWQWAGSFEQHDSPVSDRSGQACGRKQSGPVWFLAGTYGSTRTIRRCTVPQGTYLFFPLVNNITLPTSAGSITCSTAIRHAALESDDVSGLFLEVDGRRHGQLDRHRQATRSCFNLAELSEPRYEIFPSAGNGYYVMLQPLPPGTHTIKFGGELYDISQDIVYTLIVE